MTVLCCGFMLFVCFFFSSRRRHTRFDCDWSSDVCSSDLMVRRIYVDDLPALVRPGRIPVATVDAAVRRVLAAKAALGLFDDPYHGATVEREQAVLLAPEHRKLAREVAREAIVLLRNEAALL